MPFDLRTALIGPLALGGLLTLAACAGGPEPADETAAEAAPAAADEAEAAEPAATETEAAEEPAAQVARGDGLGISREAIVTALAAEDLSADAFSAIEGANGREVVAASFPPTTERQVVWIGIFGDRAAPHTVRVDYYPTQARGGEAPAVGRAMDRLLTTLFPEWPEGENWPEFAGQRAWEETAKLGGSPGELTRVPVLQTQQEGIWLEALGARPQIVSYVITSRESCRPSQTDGFYQGYASCR